MKLLIKCCWKCFHIKDNSSDDQSIVGLSHWTEYESINYPEDSQQNENSEHKSDEVEMP